MHDVVADEEHAAALVTLSASRTGQSVTDTGADVVHTRDGKAVESRDNPTDRYKLDGLLDT
ncbi:MAG TPA: hypothetical protein VIX84_20915 [Acidimicrobiales bacterium]